MQDHVPPNAVIPTSILVTRAPPNNPEVEYRRYKTMYILISLVKNNLLLDIVEFEDLRRTWMHLQKIYEVRNLMKKMHLKNLRVSKWLRAASLYFRHVPEAFTTCSTAAMCDRILPITSTGDPSIPSTRLSSIFHTRLFVSQFSSGFYIIQLSQEQGGVTKKEEGAEHLSSGYNAPDQLPSRDNTLKLHRSFSKLGSLA